MIVTGKDFNLLKHRAKNLYGAKDLEYSNIKNKKYVVTLKNGKRIHFGDSRYKDFLIHKNKERRNRYRQRASKITDKYGNLTYNNKNTANYWAYHLLW